MTPGTLFEKALHPVLFSLFPPLLFYSRNASLPFGEVLPTLALVSLGALALVYFFSFVLGGAQKAGLTVTACGLFFFTFGHVDIPPSAAFSLGPAVIGPNKIKLALWLAGLAGALFALWRIRGPVKNATLILNATAATLVLTVLVPLLFQKAGGIYAQDDRAVSVVAEAAGEQPDIYYIVYDEYAGIRALQREFGYDNAPFYAELRKRGFVVPEPEFSNYAQTFLSLASSLNMSYLDDVAGQTGKDSTDWSPVYALVEDSRVVRELRSLGYNFFTFRSGYHPTNFNRHADLNFQKGFLNEFMTTFAYTTMLNPVVDMFVENDKRERTLYAFETLPVIAENPLPTFTFAHLIAPHQPYGFGPEGEPVGGVYDDLRTSEEDKDEEGRWSDARKALYTGEVTFLNAKTLETVDSIIERSAQPPIIILQSDHGSKANGNLNYPSEALYKERMEIFTAVLFPGRSDVLESLDTPVNTFRLLLSAYFGKEYEVLPAKSYYSTLERPYDFSDITDFLSVIR